METQPPPPSPTTPPWNLRVRRDTPLFSFDEESHCDARWNNQNSDSWEVRPALGSIKNTLLFNFQSGGAISFDWHQAEEADGTQCFPSRQGRTGRCVSAWVQLVTRHQWSDWSHSRCLCFPGCGTLHLQSQANWYKKFLEDYLHESMIFKKNNKSSLSNLYLYFTNDSHINNYKINTT